jgi:hypothetical protein
MWTKITDTNSYLIKVGILICQNNPENIDNSLETVYAVENISPIGDITIKTENIIKVTNYKGTRMVDIIKLIEEGWFVMI